MLELDRSASGSTKSKKIMFCALGNNRELMCINFVIIAFDCKTVLTERQKEIAQKNNVEELRQVFFACFVLMAETKGCRPAAERLPTVTQPYIP